MIETEKIGEVVKFRMARTLWGRNLYFTSAYWVDGLLVDTGCVHTLKEFKDTLQDIPVKQIVNTHSHEDHIAGNAFFSEKFSAPIFAHPLALPVLAEPRKKQPLNLYRKVMWGMPQPSEGNPLGETIETEHHCFQVIHTPGHSPDHIVLYEPLEGWLFTGDAYVGGKDRALRIDYDVWGIIASLKKISELKTTLLFPASGSVHKNPREEILEKIAYLEKKGEEVLKLRKQGMGITRIKWKLFGKEFPLAYLTLGHFSGNSLVRSYLNPKHSEKP